MPMPDYSLFGDEHVRRYEATGGKIGHDWNNTSCLVLLTIGRKSGETKKFPLIYGREGQQLSGCSFERWRARPSWVVQKPARPPRCEDPGVGQSDSGPSADRDGRRKEARVADHDSAVARV